MLYVVESAPVHEQPPHNALPAQAFADLLQGQQSQGIRSDSPALPFGTDFDFNQIFNIENIPGLSVSAQLILFTL